MGRKTIFFRCCLLFSIFFTIIILLPLKTEASSGPYKVYDLELNEGKKSVKFVEKARKNKFSDALKEMKKYTNGVVTYEKSPSPLKIVAASRSQAQSYPYRKGKDPAGVTLNIYNNKGLTSAHTYIPAHYMMYVHDFLESNGRIIAQVEIQGGRGYVEVNKVDIIPMIYIENGIEIEIGGNEDYYSKKESPYKVVPKQEEYIVNYNSKYKVNELTVNVYRPSPDVSSFSLTYAIGPDKLKPGTYYSADGINFYKDRDLKKEAYKGFYAYFQWLPLRSMTNHEPKAFDRLLEDYGKRNSVMMGQTKHFIDQGLKYGMNPVFIFQQANLESAYGTSKYARERNNLFGWGAVDSDPDQAYTYDNIGEGIGIHMSSQISGYMNVNDWRHFGPAFGNKSAGITVKYASDPYYGIKVASMYYRMDKLNGFKDYNAYNLSLLADGKSYSVKKNKSTSSEWYKTRSGLKNQLIINLGEENNRIKTPLWMPNYDGVSYPGSFPLNLFEEFGYIPSSGISSVSLHGPKGKEPTKPKGWTPPKKELIHQKPTQARTTANVNFRKSFSVDSSRLGTIPKGTKLVVEPTNIGWARTTYNGNTGYVSMSYLKIEGGSSGDAIANAIGGRIENKILTGIKLNTKLSSVETNITKVYKNAKVTLYDKSNKNKSKSSSLVTGDKLKVTLDGEKIFEHRIAIKGDINGDGRINSSDYILTANHIMRRKILSGPELVALDVNGDGIVNSADFVALANHIMGRRPIH